MGWFRAKRKRPAELNRKDALAARPAKNAFVDEEDAGEGLVRLTYPVALKPWFARVSRIMGYEGEYRGQKKLELDQMGSAAWRLIDGERSVADLIECFVELYGIHKIEAETAMTAFIRELGRRGLIGLH